MPSKLEQLSQLSTIVADTGEIELIRKFQPMDCTTNPSLLFKAAQIPSYRELVNEALEWGRGRTNTREGDIAASMDRLTVSFGTELTRIVPGYVSTEVDAALSFDTEGTIAKAHQLLNMYEAMGVDRNRILIKTASTWEGIRAAEQLQRDGVNCNMTLIFSLTQAMACADVGAFLVSPFVGRITDWYKASEGRDFAAQEDPGVLSVRRIYNNFKSRGYDTIVMAASFRNSGQIEALAGCDRLTISPALLDELSTAEDQLTRQLSLDESRADDDVPADINESDFRWLLNENAMATEKLAEGIRRFHSDGIKLREYIASLV